MTILDNYNASLWEIDKWEKIPWKLVDTQMKNLRCRIFKATREKNYKKLRLLQRLMVRSYVNVLHSARRVTKVSRGKKTPGIDNQVFLTNETRLTLAREIHTSNLRMWDPPPVKRIYIPKPDGRKRPIGIPTIKDRIIQGIILNSLEPEWEAKFEPSSYGFRPGKSYQDAVHRVFTLLSKKDRVWIVEGDITGCFDNINHDYLMEQVKDFPYSYLIKRWLIAGIFDEGKFKETEVGTPQGGVISPLLSNITLHGLEDDLGIVYDSQGYITAVKNPLRRTIIRYADDFIVVCPSKEIAELTIKDLTIPLSRRGLELNETKTKISLSLQGFDFLGFNFVHRIKLGYEHIYIGDCSYGIDPYYQSYFSTIVTPSQKSLKNICERLSTIFRKHRGKSALELINKINPVIRGYCESKRTQSFSQGAGRLNNHLYKLQMRWIHRAHPKKSTAWVVSRYFTHFISAKINNKWVFTCPDTKTICIVPRWYSSKRNWPPVVGSYCPDDSDPRIQKYFIDRKKSLFASKVVDLISNWDYSLAKSQDHICPVCQQSLYNDFDLQRHHIMPIANGGENKLNNLVLVHLHCHQHVHFGGNLEQWIDFLKQFKSLNTTKLISSPLKYNEIVD